MEKGSNGLMPTNKWHWSLLALCLVILIITGAVTSNTFTDGGSYTVENTRIAYDGYTLSGSLYVPKAALEKDEDGNFINKVPGVVAHGGGGTTRSVQEDIAIELVQRGFVVFTLDAFNHGLSDRYDYGSHRGDPGFRHVDYAVRYLHSLEFVDDTNIGYTGHSQGSKASQWAANRYAGYYTLQDLLLIMLHDELGVEISNEQVAAQDADAIAAELNEYDQGYYASRKAEIAYDYENSRIKWVLGQGTFCNETTAPTVVDVAGNSVMRNIQCNVAFAMPLENETGIPRDGGPDPEPVIWHETEEGRLLYGTGEEDIGNLTLYSVNLSDNDQQAASDVLETMDGESWKDETVRAAADAGTLRMLYEFTGWHTANYHNQGNIDAVVEFACISTGYNNGYLAETGGDGAVSMGDSTWRIYEVANVVALGTLLVLIGVIAIVMLRARFSEPLLAELPPAPLKKKDPVAWATLVAVVLIPLLLMAVCINNNPFTANTFPTQHNRVTNVAFWSVISAIVLFVLMIVKWHLLDKKKTSLSFCEFFGVKINGKKLLISLAYAFAVLAIIYGVIWLYQDIFNGAAFNLQYFNTVHFKIISTERYLDLIMYAIYFLPFWLVSGMFVNSFRMSDMPDWLTTTIQAVLNCLGIGAYVTLQYMGYIWSGGTHAMFGLNWNSTYLVVGLILAMPASVVYSRKIYNRTGSIIPGALVNTLIFTLMQMNNVVGD